MLSCHLLACSFDFTGVAGTYYALISDESLAVNAKFGTAYTTGLAIDHDTLLSTPFHEQGTVSMGAQEYC